MHIRITWGALKTDALVPLPEIVMLLVCIHTGHGGFSKLPKGSHVQPRVKITV